MADDHELLFTFIGLDAGIRLHPTGRIAITVFYSFQAGDILKRDNASNTIDSFGFSRIVPLPPKRFPRAQRVPQPAQEDDLTYVI